MHFVVLAIQIKEIAKFMIFISISFLSQSSFFKNPFIFKAYLQVYSFAREMHFIKVLQGQGTGKYIYRVYQ